MQAQRAVCAHTRTHTRVGGADGYCGVEGNHPRGPGGGGGVMLCQRALLERTSSAGNEPNRANFGARRWRLGRVLVVLVGGPSGKMMIN